MSLPLSRRPVPLLLLVLVATACGSTVPNAEQLGGVGAGPSGGLAADGLTPSTGGLPGQPGTGTPDGPVVGAPLPGSGGAAGGGTAPGGSAPGAPGSGSAPGQGGVAIATPGVTDKEIYVGVVHDQNAGAINEAAGLGAITSGDDKANTEAIIKDINRRGGIAGRKLVPVYASFDSTSAQTMDQQWAAVCQKFTRDQPRVFAVIDSGLVESYRECIAKAGVLMVTSGLPTTGAEAFRRYPLYVELGYPNVDRLAAHHVAPLVAQDYFTPWNSLTGQPAATGAVKVGIYTYDDKVFSSAVDRHLVPALRKLGYDPIVARIAQINTASDYSSQAAAAKSAQLTFATNGVTHVIPFETNGGLSVFFLANARSQGYYPRYGVSSASGIQALIDTGAYDQRQFNGTVGFGWIPSLDIPLADYKPDGPYSNAARRACLKVMRDNGITFDSGNAEGIAMASCATLYLLKTAGDRAGARLTATTFMRAVESLGTSYEKAGGLGQEFRPGRHDPANKAYFWRYVDSCTCMQYRGRLHTIP